MIPANHIDLMHMVLDGEATAEEERELQGILTANPKHAPATGLKASSATSPAAPVHPHKPVAAVLAKRAASQRRANFPRAPV